MVMLQDFRKNFDGVHKLEIPCDRKQSGAGSILIIDSVETVLEASFPDRESLKTFTWRHLEHCPDLPARKGPPGTGPE
jgi:hypothetical protein